MDKTIKKRINNKISTMQKNGQLDKAIALCQQTLQHEPTNASVHITLGDLFLEKHLDVTQSQQYIEDAITEYQFALELDLDNIQIHHKIGVAFYHQNNYDKAINHFNTAINLDESYADSYYMLSKTAAKKHNIVEALEYVDKAICVNKLKASRAYYLKFQLLRARVIKKISNFWLVYSNLLFSLFTLPFDKAGREEFYNKLSYFKYLPIFIKGVYYEKTQNYYEAIELYSDAIEKASGFIAFYQLLGDIYRAIGRIEDSINEYRMVLYLDPLNIMAYRSLCSLYEEQGDYNNAIYFYKKLIEINPEDPIYYSNLGNIFYLKGELKEAVSAYQTAITLNPNSKWTSVIAQTLGYVLQESRENIDGAISAYQSAFILNPSDIDIYINLGSAFYEKGDYANALTSYKVALDIDPENARIHCNLGYILWGKGLIDDAIASYERAIKFDPEYDIAYNNLAVIYLDDLGRINKAVELFNQATEFNPNYALAYYNWARAMVVKNNKIEAARLYQTALDINLVTNELDEAEIRAKIDDLFD